ncbi:MAG: sugar kinase [Pseudomonadota bacterium]
MDRSTDTKIILVTRKTRLDDLVVRHNTIGQARFYVEHLGANFDDYLTEHTQYGKARTKAESSLGRFGRVHVIDRAFLPNFIFGRDDVIVVLGQDGLVANTVKYSSERPIIGVNPDPGRWDGKLLPFKVGDLKKVVPEVVRGRRPIKEVTMAKAELNTGQELHAVNDLFIGVKSHVSARYAIDVGGKREQHSSSGIIVSTGLGSTGWFTSLLRGATAIAGAVTGSDLPPQGLGTFAWDADYLYFTVREPFPSRTSSTSLVFGKITREDPLILISQTPENGVIFSDGIEKDFLEFNSGTRALVAPAHRKGHLVV